MVSGGVFLLLQMPKQAGTEATEAPVSRNAYNFVVEASSFEKGLGNIKRWCLECPETTTLRLYIPTFTLNELDFLRYKRKSFVARESLKFIDNIHDHPSGNPELIIEFPDIPDILAWSEVLEFVGDNPKDLETLNKLPKRLKDLVKSCLYKCQFDGSDGLKWILITEDPQVRNLANICRIPWCSLVDADSALTKEMNVKQYKESKKFNDFIVKSGIKEETTKQGQRVVKTNFEKTVYAPRGRGELWSP